MVLRDISGEITSIGNERAQNLNQNIAINGVIGDFRIKVEHQGFQSLNPILTNGYKKLEKLQHLLIVLLLKILKNEFYSIIKT